MQCHATFLAFTSASAEQPADVHSNRHCVQFVAYITRNCIMNLLYCTGQGPEPALQHYSESCNSPSSCAFWPKSIAMVLWSVKSTYKRNQHHLSSDPRQVCSYYSVRTCNCALLGENNHMRAVHSSPGRCRRCSHLFQWPAAWRHEQVRLCRP
jgi:hypothetical protein